MSQKLQNFAKFQKLQLDNLGDFEKCCKTRIFLQKSVPIQPETSNILPKFCQFLGDLLPREGDGLLRPLPRELLEVRDEGLRVVQVPAHFGLHLGGKLRFGRSRSNE